MTLQECPSIILHKIYWYIWHNLQIQLCKEYLQKIYYDEYRMSIKMNFQNFKNKTYHIWYNWRLTVFDNADKQIYKIENNKIISNGILPINYFFSNGLNFYKNKNHQIIQMHDWNGSYIRH